MTGMAGATVLNGEDETEADEELEDAEDSQLGTTVGADAQP